MLRRLPSGKSRRVSAISAMMPPSPRLSARMMNDTYLPLITIISAQKTSDRIPSTLSGVMGTG